MHIVFTILICIIKLTEKSSRQSWKTIVPWVFPLQNYKLGTKEVWGWKHVRRSRKIPSPITEKFTKMKTKVFVLLEVVLLMYIFTHYWQKWLVDVVLYRHTDYRFFIIFLDSTKFKIVWIKITTFFKRRVSILLWSFSS